MEHQRRIGNVNGPGKHEEAGHFCACTPPPLSAMTIYLVAGYGICLGYTARDSPTTEHTVSQFVRLACAGDTPMSKGSQYLAERFQNGRFPHDQGAFELLSQTGRKNTFQAIHPIRFKIDAFRTVSGVMRERRRTGPKPSSRPLSEGMYSSSELSGI